MGQTSTILQSWITWVTLIACLLNLIAIAYGIFKIVNKNEREWIQKKDRMIEMERTIISIQAEVKTVVAISVQITD